MAAIREGGDYVSNLAWYKCWIDESKGIFERLTDWGILAQYPKASEAGDFFEKEDFWGYRATYDRLDRHKKWIATLERYEIPFLEHTMAADLLTKDGAVCGAVALHVPSGATITVRAKAVLLATGGGSYKPTGYPVGTDTFDGEYMAWKLGLPIAGKEYEDFHSTSNNAPGNVFYDNHWQYLENIWLCGGDVSEKNASEYASNKGNIMAMGRVRGAVYGVAKSDGSEIQDVATANYTRRGGSQVYESDPEELRSGKMSTPVGRSDLAGAATGMCCHLTSGVFCGFEVRNDVPGMPGLFVAGDGTHCTAPSGAAYPCGVGFTSCFCSIDGDHAGKAAAAWVRGKELASADEEQIEAKLAEITAPLQREKGFDPNWARDVLHSIMAPYWVSVAKTEPDPGGVHARQRRAQARGGLQPRSAPVHGGAAQGPLGGAEAARLALPRREPRHPLPGGYPLPKGRGVPLHDHPAEDGERDRAGKAPCSGRVDRREQRGLYRPLSLLFPRRGRGQGLYASENELGRKERLTR